MAQHFVQPPDWGWWIAGYFFLAGLAGGSYTLATILRIWGSPRDEVTARIGYLIAFPLAVLCGIFLTIDLGQPLRFWHMLVNVTPGEAGLNFKYWSPISIGSWALLIFSVFSFVSFLEVAVANRASAARDSARTRPSGLSRGFAVVGSLIALFLASYTGVVLSVSNQPIWSDSWAIGALFVASALSGSAALLAWLSHGRGDAQGVEGRLLLADRYFAALELLMIAIFFFTLAPAGTLGKALGGPWLILWILVIVSLVPPLLGLGYRRPVAAKSGSAVMVTAGSASGIAVAVGVLVGVLLMRLAVIFSAQS